MKSQLPATCEVAIIGAGPAGLSTAIALKKQGVSDIIVLERSEEAGGNPRHCGHSPFGLREFKRIYLGPAFAKKIVETAQELGIKIALNTTVTSLGKGGSLSLTTPEGLTQLNAKRVVISSGTRETPRSARLVSGRRPKGIMTTGALQSLVYLGDTKPFEKPVIIGSELVSFSAIATCRHAGIKPVAMLEENKRITAYTPMKFIAPLLGTKLLLDTQLIEILGKDQVTGVIIQNAHGETSTIDCDGVIFSGKFVPEASLARMGHLEIDPKTNGPIIDQYCRCSDPGYFATGNVLRPVETGDWCWNEGKQLAQFVKQSLAGKLPGTEQQIQLLIKNERIKYIIPQRLSRPSEASENELIQGIKHFQLRVNQPSNGKIFLAHQTDSTAREFLHKNIHTLPERRILMSISLPDEAFKADTINVDYSKYS